MGLQNCFKSLSQVAPLQNPQIPGAPLLPTPGAPVVSAPTSTVQPPTLPEAPLSEQTKPQPQQATASSSSTTSVPVKVPPPAANSRIIHPEDNLSLVRILLHNNLFDVLNKLVFNFWMDLPQIVKNPSTLAKK